jgi:hypothetical protein
MMRDRRCHLNEAEAVEPSAIIVCRCPDIYRNSSGHKLFYLSHNG